MFALQAIHHAAFQGFRGWSLCGLLLLAVGLACTLIGISPFGISAPSGLPATLFESAFVGGLAGCSLGTLRTSQSRALLARAASSNRIVFELGSILVPTVGVALAATAPYTIALTQPPPILALGLLLTHMTAIALLLAALPLRPSGAALLIPVLIWITPSFLGPNDPRLPVRLLCAALDPTRGYTLLAQGDSLVSPLLASLAPIIALLCLRAAISPLGRPSKNK